MKIVFTNPNYWPYVRRGAERYINDMARFLIARGHTVQIITSTPGTARRVTKDGLTITYLPQVRHPVFSGMRLLRHDFFGLAVYPLLAMGRYDVIDSMANADGAAAVAAGRRNGAAVQFRVIVVPPVFGRPWDAPLALYAIRKADRAAAVSRWSARWAEAYAGSACHTLYPMVDAERFQPGTPRNPREPVVLFASDLLDPKKGGALLMLAFKEVQRRCPNAVLQLVGPGGNRVPADLLALLPPSARARVRMLGANVDLVRCYQEASVTVLPSIEEPFGMVLAESLACGTPIVGSRQGGAAEIVGEAPVGRLIDLATRADLESHTTARNLADAILASIELAADPATTAACRERAMQFSIDTLGPELEQVYVEMAKRGSSLYPQIKADFL